MVELDEIAARTQLAVGEEVLGGVEGGNGDALCLRGVHHLDLGALQQPGVEQRVDLRPELGVEQVVGVAAVVDQVLASDHAAEAVPPVGVAEEVDVAVLAGQLAAVDAVGEGAGAQVAVLGDEQLAAVGVGHDVLRRAVERAGEHLLDREVDALAAPEAHARGDRPQAVGGGHRAREEERGVEPGPVRLAPGVGGHGQCASHRVEQHVVGLEVAVRAVLPEVGDRDERGGRVDLGELLLAQPEAGERAGAEVLDDGVGPRGEAAQDALPTFGLEVEREAALPGVEVEEEPAALGMRLVVGEGAGAPRGVAAVGPLDLDHVGAVVAEQLGAVRAGDPLREVEDAQTVEGARAHRCSFRPRLGSAGL